MASVDEFKVRALLEESRYLWQNRETDQTYPEKARRIFDEADSLVRSKSRNISQGFSLQILVLVSETGMMLEDKNDVAERLLDLYFQYASPFDQFYIRALLAYAQLQAFKVRTRGLKGQDAIDQTKLAYTYIQKAIETIIKPENKQKYTFLIYNTSVSVWNMLRPMLLPGFSKSFTENLEKISALLEEIDDFDVSWRIRYLQALSNAYLDADRKVDAQKTLDKIWDIMKRKGQVSYIETLWRMKVHVNKENAGIVGGLRKEAEASKSDLKFFVAVQQIRSGGIPDAQVEKEIQGLLQLKPGSEGLAEIGRAALQYNLMAIAKQCLDAVESARQPSLRARVWHEYSKAEYLVKDAPEQIDRSTGMKFTPAQLKAKECERRIEALKIIDRAMVANKRLNDAGVTTEGCILIWNIGKPLLTPSNREHIYKAFQTASSYLEFLDSPLHELRIFLYMEIAKYELEQGFIAKAESQIARASILDATNFKLTIAANEHENVKQLQRPYERMLYPLGKKLELKKNIYKEPDRFYEQAWLDIENARNMKNQAARETVLKKAAEKILMDVEPVEKLEDDLVEEEKQERLKVKKFTSYKELKLKFMIAGDLAEVAFDTALFDLAAQMSEYCLSHEWDPLKEIDLVSMQANCHYVLAKCKAQRVISLGYEPGFNGGVEYGAQPTDTIETCSEAATELKRQLLNHVKLGAKLSVSINQPWLCFNAGVTFWNIYLNVVRYPLFEKHIFPDAIETMKNLIETMNGQIEKQVLSSQAGVLAPFNRATDFKYPHKLQIFAEIGIMLSKILYVSSAFEDGVKICDILLTKPIGPAYRKELERIKGACTAIKAPAAQKGAVKPADSSTAEVFSLMENAKAVKKDPTKKAIFLDSLKKANTLLQAWSVNDTDENELILHAELWCKLGRQTFEAVELNKLALVCAQRALIYKDKGVAKQRRLSWYSVAEFLYGEVLVQLVDEKRQEKESQNALRAAALDHFVKSAELGMKTNIKKLVLDSGRAMFNTSLKISGSEMLITPMAKVASMLVQLKEDSDPDFLLLFYRALIDALTATQQWEKGEKLLEDAFLIVPMSHQKWLWEAQIVFLSKQGKNVLNYLLRMKESNPLMQAKIWVKLARSSVDAKEIDSAYKKASEILEGNIECSDILIEWSTWLHSRGEDVVGKLKLAAEIIVDVEKEGDEDNKSQNSQNSRQSGRSSNRSSSKVSAASKSNISKSKSKITSRDEVDGNPEKLNVTHFDRLIRIYMMQGELAPNANRRKQYCLNAFNYIMRTLELTLGAFSREKQDWAEFKIPEETLIELEKAEDREKLCKFAYDKIQVSHLFLRQLAQWLEEVFLQQWECLLVLEYLKIFSRVVLKSQAYEWIYSSWKLRVYKKLGIEKDPIQALGKFLPEESNDVGEELFKREEFIEAEKILRTTGNKNLLARISFMQGKLKSGIRLHEDLLSEKTIENLKLIPDIAHYLMSAGKFQEAYTMLTSSISILSNYKSNNSLTLVWILVSLNLTLSHICALQSPSPVNTKDERNRYKAHTDEGLKFFLQTSKIKGCNAGHIFQYLHLHDLLAKRIENKLVSRINREVMTRRLERLGKLRNLLTVCSSLCVDLLDIDYPGEGQGLSGLIDWRIGEVTVLAEIMRKELVKRSSYDNVITKYLDEMDLMIQEENRKKSKSDSVAELIDEGLDSALKYFENALGKIKPSAPVYNLICISSAMAKALNNEEFVQPEPVVGIKYTAGLYRLHLLGFFVKTEGADAFSNLAFLQSAKAREHLLETFLTKGKMWLKDRLLISLMCNQGVQNSLYQSIGYESHLTGSHVWKNLNWKPSFEDIKERIQPSSAVLILQYSVDMVDAWGGLMLIDKDKNSRFWFNTKRISTEEQLDLQSLLEKFRAYKNFVLKNPIADEGEQESHWAEAERRLDEILGKMREIGAWLESISEFINPGTPVEIQEEHPKKKAPAPVKGKADDKNMDTGLPLPTSGVATLYLCIDSRFIELPWESLPFISIVPIIVRDFSIVNLDYRQAHSTNFAKDSLKYIIERPLEPKAGELSDKLAQELNTAKFEGNRMTSTGQWEKICSQASLLINLQSSGIDLQACSSLSSSSCSKGIVALDSFNTVKRYMKKSVGVETGLVEMLSLLGCNSIIKNCWSVSPLNAVEFAAGIWKSLAAGQSIGGSLYRNKQSLRPALLYSFQHYGLPYSRAG